MGSTADPADVALFKARYIAAFERYCAQAAKLAEQSKGGQAPLVPELDEERKALEDFAAVRSTLLVALAMSEPQLSASLAAETRDQVIRRSIAKRSEGSLDTPVRRRLSRRRRIA
ncbi:MAG TPA: hypothetical protein VNA66_06130 [Gammaproteobacteria bacterium]|nr:hypothetical protein [Gammaproteobacteria bacterium]